MSYIVPKKIPEFCYKCPFNSDHLYGDCCITGKSWDACNRGGRRPDWCPLVEVPKDYSEDSPAGALCKKCLCFTCEWRESCGTLEGNTSEYCRSHCKGEVGCMTRCAEFKRRSLEG